MGRGNHANGLFVMLAQQDIRSAAYRALSAHARCAIVELDLYYWETARINPMVLSQLWLADRLKVNPKTAARILDDLETHWFAELERAGKLTGPNGDRGALYRLTWLPTSDGHPATRESRGWRPIIAGYSAPRRGASTDPIRQPDAGPNGYGHTRFRQVGISAREMLQRAQTQRALGGDVTVAKRGRT